MSFSEQGELTMSLLAKLILTGIMLALAPGMSAIADETQRLVLVADARSNLPPLTLRELRRAYLGVPVLKAGQRLQPLINLTDERLYEVFLQKVMHMSSQTYQRQLTSRFLRAKGRRPPIYRNLNSLLEVLSKEHNAITYILWDEAAKKDAGLKIIAVLWGGKS